MHASLIGHFKLNNNLTKFDFGKDLCAMPRFREHHYDQSNSSYWST